MPSGSRLAVATAPDDALVLRPAPPSEGAVDVGAAVRDALRFPLSGSPLEAIRPIVFLVSRSNTLATVWDPGPADR